MQKLTEKIYEAKNLDLDEYKEGMIVRMDGVVYKLVSDYKIDTSKLQMNMVPLDVNDRSIPQTLKYFIKSKQIDILAPSILDYHSPFAIRPLFVTKYLSRGKEVELPKNMQIEIPEGAAVKINIIDQTTSNFRIRVLYNTGNGMNYFYDDHFDSKREATAEGWEI